METSASWFARRMNDTCRGDIADGHATNPSPPIEARGCYKRKVQTRRLFKKKNSAHSAHSAKNQQGKNGQKFDIFRGNQDIGGKIEL